MTEIPQTVVRVAAGGRIVIPAHLRKKLGIEEGDKIVLSLEEDTIQMLSQKQALRRAQDRIAKHVRPGVSLADELIRERRQEARERRAK
ncbi:MAG: AbrB/MazE/SpoVT family DNA-binding domain-containing protein [Bryobacterales bacterium]